MTHRACIRAAHGRSLLLAAGLALGLAAPLAMADPASAATGRDDAMVTWGGSQMKAADLIGRPVMMKGEQIGEVVDLISRDNTYNDAIVKLRPEHSQMGIAVGKSDQRMAGNRAPTVVGGTTVAVPLSSLRSGQGNALTLDEGAVTTVRQFGLYTRSY